MYLTSSSSINPDLFAGGMAIASGLVIIFSIIVGFVIGIAMYLLMTIPLYKMAKRAGLNSPGICFIPMVNFYVMMMIPHRTFKLNDKFKTDDRKKVFWIYLGITVGFAIASTIVAFVVGIIMIIPIIGAILGIIMYILFYAIILLITVVMSFILWRVFYDVLMTYTDKSTALWVSIISVFVFPVFYIYLWIIAKKDPNYGVGNYYDYSNWIHE